MGGVAIATRLFSYVNVIECGDQWGGQAARRYLPFTALTFGHRAYRPRVSPSLSPDLRIQPPHAIDPLLSSLPAVHPRCPGILPPACPPVPTNMRGEEGMCPLAAAASAVHTASSGA